MIDSSKMQRVPIHSHSNMCVALYTNFKKKDKEQGSSVDIASSNVNAINNTQVRIDKRMSLDLQLGDCRREGLLSLIGSAG